MIVQSITSFLICTVVTHLVIKNGGAREIDSDRPKLFSERAGEL